MSPPEPRPRRTDANSTLPARNRVMVAYTRDHASRDMPTMIHPEAAASMSCCARHGTPPVHQQSVGSRDAKQRYGSPYNKRFSQVSPVRACQWPCQRTKSHGHMHVASTSAVVRRRTSSHCGVLHRAREVVRRSCHYAAAPGRCPTERAWVCTTWEYSLQSSTHRIWNLDKKDGSPSTSIDGAPRYLMAGSPSIVVVGTRHTPCKTVSTERRQSMLRSRRG